MLIRLLSVMILIEYLVAPLAAQDANERNWGEWRGPLATGVAPEADPPIEWNDDKNIRWKVERPGRGHSTPIVWGDRIFVTTAFPVGDELPPKYSGRPGEHDNHPVTHRSRFVALAIDRTDGSIVWEKNLREELPVEGAHFTRLNGIPVFNEIVKAFHPAGAGGDLYLRRGCTDEDENSEDYDSETCFLNVANNAATARKLRQVYGKVKYVDPYVGLLMEDPIADSLFGPIQTAIVVDQFVRLRDGDRFWYENTENGVFDASEVAEIKARSMADVISDNFGVPRAKLQDFVFLSPRAVK
jgi:hypothetical protein